MNRLLGIGAALLVLAFGVWMLVGRPHTPVDSPKRLHVMTYSSFMSAWGPGPEIKKRFREKTGFDVDLQDAGDAGLILEKLKLFPADVVLGLDELALPQARTRLQWNGDFIPIDEAPIAFVYRKKEVDPPPRSLEDLTSPRFAGAISLEDPRTSTPGLLFFFWVLDEMGEQKGFEFLRALKPNIHAVSPSWTAAYGLFKHKQAKLVLSFLTSPVYHSVEEKDESFAAAVFPGGQPMQKEFAGIPTTCVHCEEAKQFIAFLRSPEIQTLIMKKNYMLPVDKSVMRDTPFAALPAFKVRDLKSAPDLLARRQELFEKWRALGL